jgi:hypothetical protein
VNNNTPDPESCNSDRASARARRGYRLAAQRAHAICNALAKFMGPRRTGEPGSLRIPPLSIYAQNGAQTSNGRWMQVGKGRAWPTSTQRPDVGDGDQTRLCPRIFSSETRSANEQIVTGRQELSPQFGDGQWEKPRAPYQWSIPPAWPVSGPGVRISAPCEALRVLPSSSGCWDRLKFL